jgi:transcriptional regulator
MQNVDDVTGINIMYTPKFADNKDDASIRQFIRQNSFGIIVSQLSGKLMASHIPLELQDESKLLGHVSRANPQWKNFETGGEVLTIFNGPHAYISSSWYDHENVPTWNYIAVHVYGKIRIIDGDELLNSLKKMVDKYEVTSQRPVSIEGMSPDYVRKSLNAIVGFEISISSIDASYKLSQNRDSKNQMSIIAELEARSDSSSRSIASIMKKNLLDYDKG